MPDIPEVPSALDVDNMWAARVPSPGAFTFEQLNRGMEEHARQCEASAQDRADAELQWYKEHFKDL